MSVDPHICYGTIQQVVLSSANGDIVDEDDLDGDGYHENGAIIIEHTSGLLKILS